MFLGQRGRHKERQQRQDSWNRDNISLAIEINDEGRKNKKHAQCFRPAGDVTDRFSLYRMQQEKAGGEERQDASACFLHAGPVQHLANGQENENGVEKVQEHIERVIAECILRAGLLVVQPIAEHEEGPQLGYPSAKWNVGGIRLHIREVGIVQKKRSMDGRPINLKRSEQRDH